MIITYNNPKTQANFTIECNSREVSSVLQALINLGFKDTRTYNRSATPATKPAPRKSTSTRKITRTAVPAAPATTVSTTDQVRAAMENIVLSNS